MRDSFKLKRVTHSSKEFLDFPKKKTLVLGAFGSVKVVVLVISVSRSV